MASKDPPLPLPPLICENCCNPIDSIYPSANVAKVKSVVFYNQYKPKEKISWTIAQVFKQIFDINLPSADGLDLCSKCSVSLTVLCRTFEDFTARSAKESTVGRKRGQNLPLPVPKVSSVPGPRKTIKKSKSVQTDEILFTHTQEIPQSECTLGLESLDNFDEFAAESETSLPISFFDDTLGQEFHPQGAQENSKITVSATKPGQLNRKGQPLTSRHIPLTKEDLEGDLVQMKTLGEYTCTKCARIFRGKYSNSSIRSHLIRVHFLDKSIAIAHCNSQNLAKQKEELKEESKFRNAVQRLEKWNRKISTTGQVKDRERTHPCHQCDKIFYIRNDLRRHVQAIHEGKLYKCSICEKQVKNLTTHMKTHGDKNHLCYLCGKSYFYKAGLRAHFRQKHDPATATAATAEVKVRVLRHKCNLCERAFEFANQLKVHALRHQEPSLAKYCCQWANCGKKYQVQKDLAKHLEYHKLREEKPTKCPLCDKRLVSKRNLSVHFMFTHKLSREEARERAGIKPQFTRVTTFDIIKSK